jgi:hypothetical protein
MLTSTKASSSRLDAFFAFTSDLPRCARGESAPAGAA